jgi:hypothetical protein
MEAFSLVGIQHRIIELASSIGALDSELPTFGRSEDGARPHIEVAGPFAYYVVVERGQELERWQFADLDALLHRVFADITFQVACRFELRNRRPGEDSRRLMFAKQLEHLTHLNPSWAARERERLNGLLKQHPFSDHLSKTHEL